MRFNICNSPERELKEKIEKELWNLEHALQNFQLFQHKITFEHGTALNCLLGEDYCQTVSHELQATLEHLKEIIDDAHAKLDTAIKQYEEASAVLSHGAKEIEHEPDSALYAKEIEHEPDSALYAKEIEHEPDSALSYPSTEDLWEEVLGELKKELVTPVAFVDALDNKPPKEPPALPPKRRRKKPLKYEPPRKIRYRLANRSAYMDARNHPPKNPPNES